MDTQLAEAIRLMLVQQAQREAQNVPTYPVQPINPLLRPSMDYVPGRLPAVLGGTIIPPEDPPKRKKAKKDDD